jgi:hypothetical protein
MWWYHINMHHSEIPDSYFWVAEMYPEPEWEEENWEKYVDDIMRD